MVWLGSTYGLDVVVSITLLRQEGRYSYSEIQAEFSSSCQISRSQVRYLYQPESFLSAQAPL